MAPIKKIRSMCTVCSGWLMCVVVLQLYVKNNHICFPQAVIVYIIA